MTRNRMWNVRNPHQGPYKRVLCVCSAGLLRSPTAAYVLSQEPYRYNTRAVGVDADHALVPIDRVLLAWAHEIVTMEPHQERRVMELLDEHDIAHPKLVCLGIADNFGYRDPELMRLIEERYHDVSGFVQPHTGKTGS